MKFYLKYEERYLIIDIKVRLSNKFILMLIIIVLVITRMQQLVIASPALRGQKEQLSILFGIQPKQVSLLYCQDVYNIT